jgi:polyferredoxin
LKSTNVTEQRTQFRADLLAPALVRRCLAWPGVPLAFQAAILIGLILLIVNGWRIGAVESAEQLLTLRKTNVTTLVVWGLWWPSMIALAIIAGRAWCTLCPMELVSRIGLAAGRRMAPARVRLPRWMRAGWLVVLAYLMLQVLVAGASVHRVPHATSVILLALLGLALVAGVVFREERAFCKTLCPARALLSVYGRLTPAQLDVRSADVCQQCKTRDCVRAEHRARFDRRSCPSLIRPFARRAGDDCVLCLQCAKVCPHANIGFGIVRPGASSRQARLLSPAEALFVVIASGFVAHEVIGESGGLEPWFHLIPSTLHAWLPGVGFGWWESVWFLGLFPFLLWTIIAVLAWLRSPGQRFGVVCRAAATAAAPVVAVAHLAKACAKVSAWGGFLPGALADPAGLNTLGRLSAGAPSPQPLASLGGIAWLILLALLCVAWKSRQLLAAEVSGSPWAWRLAPATLMALYSIVFLAWIVL